jgi:hypothetical protein
VSGVFGLIARASTTVSPGPIEIHWVLAASAGQVGIERITSKLNLSKNAHLF